MVGAANGLLSDELPVYLGVLSRTFLSSILSGNGPRAMVESITSGVVDRALTYVETHQSEIR